MLAGLHITEWDFLIFGDGSGSNWDRACAWGAVTIERATGERRPWWGFSSRGSVNVAEIMACLQPLLFIANREMDRSGHRRANYVHIITDSQYCQSVGASDNRQPIKNAGLWEQFHAIARQGFVIEWHWVPRGSVAMNCVADTLSRVARRTFQSYNMEEGSGTSTAALYEISP